MALVAAGFTGTVTLVDQGGNKVTKTYDLRAATYATALTDMQSIIALLVPLTDAVVYRYAVNTIYNENAFAYPTGGVQVENIAEVVLLLSTGVGKTARHQIPAATDDVYIGSAGKNYNIVDSAEVQAYLAIFTADDGVAYISDGEMTAALGAYQSGKRVHRANRNG